MMRALTLLVFLLLPAAALAQGQQCRTSPVGASTTYCASEAFVTQGEATIDGQTGAFTTGNGIDSIGQVIELTAARRTLPAPCVILVTSAAHCANNPSDTSANNGTYTTPANALWLEVECIGGAAGAAGGGTSGQGPGTAGGNTTFGTSLLTCTGGGANPNGAQPGAGGIPTGGDDNIQGGSAQGGAQSAVVPGGQGCSSPYGGAGSGAIFGANSAGSAAIANTGSGGGGGSSSSAGGNVGPGGSCGGYARLIIRSPASSYSYGIGLGGTGGIAGASGTAGGNGASGRLKIIPHFGS